MSYHFNENASYSHMFTPNWLANAQTTHANVLNAPKSIVSSLPHHDPATTTWLHNVTESQVNAMNLHRVHASLHENTNSVDSTTNSQDATSTWLSQSSNSHTDAIDLHKEPDAVDLQKTVPKEEPKLTKPGVTGIPRRKPNTYTDEEARFHCELCTYRTIKEKDFKQHVFRVHLKPKDFSCEWPNCDFKTQQRSYLKRHIDGVHLKLKKFACPLEGCDFRTDRQGTLDVHVKCDAVHTWPRPPRKKRGPNKRPRPDKGKRKDGTPLFKKLRLGIRIRGRKRGRKKKMMMMKMEKKSDDSSSDEDRSSAVINEGSPTSTGMSDSLPPSPSSQPPSPAISEAVSENEHVEYVPRVIKKRRRRKRRNVGPVDDLDSDQALTEDEMPPPKRKPTYIKKPRNEWTRKHVHKKLPAFPPGVGFYCGNCEYRTLKEGELKKHVYRIHLKPKNHICLIPGCDFKTSEGILLKRHIDGVHLKIKAFKCSWEGCPFATDRNATLKYHIRAMHLAPRPFLCTFCTKTFSSEYKRDHHINAHVRKEMKKKVIYRCKECVLDFEDRSAYRRHLLKAHSKRLAYKCRLCRYSSNVKSHLARHISDRHLRIKPFACAFCPYSCAQAGNLRSHLKRVHPEEREALEALARPEREKPFPCNHCDYRATQSGNLRTHMKNKHPAEYLAREESRIRRQAERREERALNRLLLPKKKYPKKEYPRRGRRMRGRRGRPKRKEVESSEDEDKSSEDEDKEKIEPEDDMGDEIPENGDEGLEEGDLMEGVVGDMLPEDVCHEDGDILPEEENLTGLETMPMMMEPDVDFMVDAEDIPEEREIKYVPVSVPEQAPVIQHELKYVPDQHQITLQAVQQPDQVVQQQVVIQQRELKYSAATPEQLQQVQQVTIQQQNQLQQHHELKYITTQHTSQQQPEQKFVPQQVTQQVTQVVTQHDTIPTTTQTPPIAHEAPGLVPIRGVAGYQFPASFSHHMPYL